MVLLEFNGGDALSVRKSCWNEDEDLPEQKIWFSASEQSACVEVVGSQKAVNSTLQQARIEELSVRKRKTRD